MKNRKLPFGYRMEQGRVVLHPQEAEIVKQIFQSYISGASYQELVGMLRNQPVPYDTNRPWNKNMIARILENKRYTGTKGFPLIVSAETLALVTEKRASRQCPVQRTEAQKVLRQLSGHKASPHMERTVLGLLNRLINQPDQLRVMPKSIESSGEIERLQAELDRLLEQQPVDEDAAWTLIRSIAAAEYNAIGSEEYETERLRRIFSGAAPRSQLDANLLRSAVSAIQVYNDGTITLRLKNNQIIGGDTL